MKYGTDTYFKPFAVLNDLEEDVLDLSGSPILLGNGFLYTIDKLN